VSSIKSDAIISFVQNSKNVQVTMAELAAHILGTIDASRIAINVNGIEAYTLSTALEWLYNNRGNNGNGNGGDKTAAGIPYTVDSSINPVQAIGVNPANVAVALNAIINTIYNIKQFLITATESDINQLFTELTEID